MEFQTDDVLAKVMDLLRINPWLKKIDFSDTPLERDGHVAQVNAQLASNARDYMAAVRGLPRTQAKFARVFLCGDAYAGKRFHLFVTTCANKITCTFEVSNMLKKLKINFDTSCCTFRFDNVLEKIIHPIYEIFF